MHLPEEVRRHWSVIATGALGLTAGMSATMAFTLGAFIIPLQQAFGWGRADISLAFTALTAGIFLSAPLAGRLCDRHGAALIGTASLCLFAIVVMISVSLISHIYGFWLAYFAMALAGAGTTPVVMIRPSAVVFHRHRGMALGLTLAGAGIAGFWSPPFVTAIIDAAGWRAAYFALAGLAVLAAPLVWLGFRRLPDVTATTASDTHAGHGVTIDAARRTPHFWLLSAMAFLMAMGITGVVIHCVPLLRDNGLSATAAASIASIIGLASVSGRILVGFLFDRFAAIRVGIAIFVLAAVGLLQLRQGVMPELAATLIGLAYGAEIDLLAYLSARYFGHRSYSAIYGWQYSVFAVGAGISPFWVGKLYELTGNYHLPLLVCAGLALIAASLVVALHRAGPVNATTPGASQ